MRRLLQEDMIPALWIAFALYWVLAAVRLTGQQARQSGSDKPRDEPAPSELPANMSHAQNCRK